MTALDAYLAEATEQDGQPLRLEFGLVVTWVAAGNNTVNVLGNSVANVRAVSGVTLANGDTVALLKNRGKYLAIGKVV